MDDAVEAILFEIVDAKHREYGVYLEALAQVETAAVHRPDGTGILQQLESIASVMTLGAAIDARRSAVRISVETARVRPVCAPDEVYASFRAGNLMQADALALRTEAFDYIPEPTPAVRQAHAEHLARLNPGGLQNEMPKGNKASQ